MGNLSAHFDSREFGGHPHVALVALLEQARKLKRGRPLRIVSGIRSAQHNAEVGGAPKSKHLTGEAADIPAGYLTPREAARLGFTGIGIDTTGRWAVHVDVRSSPRAAWRYLPGGGNRVVPFPSA